MSKASRTFGLFQRLLARPAPVWADAADLGTCFGLELSLSQQEEEAARQPQPQPGSDWMARSAPRDSGAA